jgi:hypothetical protein
MKSCNASLPEEEPLCSVPLRHEGRKDVDHCLMVPYRTLILFLELDKKASGEAMGEKPESPSILSSHLLTSHFPKTKTNNAGFAWESGPPLLRRSSLPTGSISPGLNSKQLPSCQGPRTIIGCRKARAVSGPPKHTVGAHRLRSLRSLNSD